MSRQVIVLGLLSMLMVGGSCGSSCVNFDGQTVRVHVDESKDRLDALLLYRDIHATYGDKSKAIEQVEEILEGARWIALFGNFPIAMNIDHMAGQEPDPEQPQLWRLVELIDEHVEVRNGEMWMDVEGRLCAWQLVRVRRLATVLDAVNAAITEQIRISLAKVGGKGGWPLADEESVALLKDALERGQPLLAFDGQAVTFTLPASDAGWARVKHEVLDDLHDALDALDALEAQDDGKAPPAEPTPLDSEAAIRFLSDHEWSIERQLDSLLFVFGSREANELRLEAPSTGLDGYDIVGDLRRRGWPVDPHGDDSGAHRAYEAFRSEN